MSEPHNHSTHAPGCYRCDLSRDEVAPETCSVEVIPPGMYSSRPCLRPAKRDGMCSQHATAKERREAKEREWKDKQEARRARLMPAMEAAREIEGILGVEVWVVSSGVGDGSDATLRIKVSDWLSRDGSATR